MDYIDLYTRAVYADLLKIFTFYIWKNVPQVFYLTWFFQDSITGTKCLTLKALIFLFGLFVCLFVCLFLGGVIMNWQGAATTCYVALHPGVKGVTGKYFVDCNELKPSSFASKKQLARKLWDFSNNLINSISKPS